MFMLFLFAWVCFAIGTAIHVIFGFSVLPAARVVFGLGFIVWSGACLVVGSLGTMSALSASRVHHIDDGKDEAVVCLKIGDLVVKRHTVTPIEEE